MTHRLSHIGLLFLLPMLVWGQYDLSVSVTHATYRAGEQPYIEFYLHVLGNTVGWDDNNSAGVDCTMFITRNDSIIGGDRFMIHSPELQDSNQSLDFVHLERKSINPGDYEVSFEFRDKTDTLNNFYLTVPVHVEAIRANAHLSDIRFLASAQKSETEGGLTKNGVSMEPLPYNFYHKNLDRLWYYAELYGADQYIKDDVVFKASVLTEKNKDMISLMHKYKRIDKKPVVPILDQLDISELTSGNYLFRLEVINREKTPILLEEIGFMRSNPAQDIAEASKEEVKGYTFLDSLDDSRLDYYLKSMVPIVANTEVEAIDYLLNKGKPEFKRTFIYRYFDEHYPDNPGANFSAYATVARAMDKMYNDGFGYGFESDRGRIYLKYGQPHNIINVQDDEGAFPYEIWFYNQIPVTNQRDVRFMFYNPDYTSNRYILLTTTCRGERQNRQWELELYRNAPGDIRGNRIDATRVRTDYRRRAYDLYTE